MMPGLEQTDRIARCTLVVAVAAACVSPFALAALKESGDRPATDLAVTQVQAKEAKPLKVKGALEARQYLLPAFGV